MIHMIIDSHLHLNDPQFDSDLDQVITEALQNDVKIMVVNGYDYQSSEQAVAIASRYPNVFATCGIHPSEAHHLVFDEKRLKALLQHPKVIGVGEIGLDYYWSKEHQSAQKELFHQQLQLAQELNLPVIIHSRDAIQDTYDIVCQYPVRGIMHCYSSSIEMAELFIKRGYLLGIGGVVTYKNAHLRQVVEKVSLNSLVTETDSPYLAPVPHRGKRNEPRYLPLIIEKIANIKQVSIEEVKTIFYHNFTNLFDLKETS
jgi:TatD DNase family protein